MTVSGLSLDLFRKTLKKYSFFACYLKTGASSIEIISWLMKSTTFVKQVEF